jgi:hypothetical protein
VEAAINKGMDDGVAGPAITSLAVRAAAGCAATAVGAAVGWKAVVGWAAEHPATVNAAVKNANETILFKIEGENFNIFSCSTFNQSGKLQKELQKL